MKMMYQAVVDDVPSTRLAVVDDVPNTRFQFPNNTAESTGM
jgi:hypothetical protein